MAKTMILLLLLSILVGAVAAAPQLSPDAEKLVDGLNDEVKKVIEGVVSAAPPAKQKETMISVLKHLRPINSALVKAQDSGDEKKILVLFFLVKTTNTMITAAPPEKKLKVMEDNFNSVAAPNPSDCPTIDKAYCETYSKIGKAVDGVLAAEAKMSEEAKASVVEKIVYPVRSTINKAYADGDEKKIAKVLAAYSKAADEVIAAAPAHKLNVTEKTFAAAATAAATRN